MPLVSPMDNAAQAILIVAVLIATLNGVIVNPVDTTAKQIPNAAAIFAMLMCALVRVPGLSDHVLTNTNKTYLIDLYKPQCLFKSQNYEVFTIKQNKVVLSLSLSLISEHVVLRGGLEAGARYALPSGASVTQRAMRAACFGHPRRHQNITRASGRCTVYGRGVFGWPIGNVLCRTG